MHKEILSKEQAALLPLVKLFADDFGLVGGTAIALHFGHRESIDYALFSFDEFINQKIRLKILKVSRIESVFKDEMGQFTFTINSVRFTFFQFPYKIDYSESFDGIVNLPNILTLAAMKAFALGRRAKWKDYVDLYFILKDHHTVSEITAKGREIFGSEFNEKIFRTQLAYFKDIDYSEKVIYRPGYEVSDQVIQKQLIAASLELSR